MAQHNTRASLIHPKSLMAIRILEFRAENSLVKVHRRNFRGIDRRGAVETVAVPYSACGG